ncbi:putative membrane protein [Burkholderia thailandensis USAMRU Malaysia |uniref:Membrane protein n=1 Tax=Burkholderia thailandensis TaxID=57975 RepID=A0AAW9D0W4_BURTH|nr:putative membrane protein [Burkholderia thailandensis H0587]AHI74141.1 putative membrane protein [Burkholderia thailandensis 2002721723]AHI79832.1 putative membrane protein [Burkholderia thailandensis E444]AIC87175.1 putative membrane protein [Burkholderia thailandensis USAMRU Malaysia \
MKRIAALAALAVVLGSVLAGCIVVPDGGYHHHRGYYYRY